MKSCMSSLSGIGNTLAFGFGIMQGQLFMLNHKFSKLVSVTHLIISYHT